MSPDASSLPPLTGGEARLGRAEDGWFPARDTGFVNNQLKVYIFKIKSGPYEGFLV